MLTPLRFGRLTLAVSLLALSAAGSAVAQSWPQKPIKVIAPYPPGGPSDLVMRTAAEKIQALLKQPIVIENQPGAGGNIGAAAVARATPDGYTFLIATDTLLTVNPHVYKTMPFKMDDLKPVSVLSSFSQTLVCNPSLGVKNTPRADRQGQNHAAQLCLGRRRGARSFVDRIAAQHDRHADDACALQRPRPGHAGRTGQPGALRFAGWPHRAAACALGQAERFGRFGPVALTHLARCTHHCRSRGQGLRGRFQPDPAGPKQVPDEVVAKFRQAVVDALRSPEATERLKATDQVVIGSTPEVAAAKIAKDHAKWGAVSRKIGLSLD